MKLSILKTVLLSVAFGPVGVLYVNKRMGVAMIVAGLLLPFVSLAHLMLSSESAPYYLALAVMFWTICVVMAIQDATHHNATIDGSGPNFSKLASTIQYPLPRPAEQ